MLLKTFARGFRRYGEYVKNYGWDPEYFQGGQLPRYKKLTPDIPKLCKPQHIVKDAWSPNRATFGQNDFIDILGDGGIDLRYLMPGPRWLKGFKGNEYQRLLRQIRMDGPIIKRKCPQHYHNILIRMKYLYWRYNYKFNGRRYSVYAGKDDL
ncbi:hypothetical protein GJ496_005823 [Pomphorhynchus laevis]|nr:hypothetical protein GJ496_005823 [Pomphorhynchus laevis]